MVWDGAGLKYECEGSDHWVKYGFICDLYKTIKPLVRYGFIRRGHALDRAACGESRTAGTLVSRSLAPRRCQESKVTSKS